MPLFELFLLVLISQNDANPRIKRFTNGKTAEGGQFPFLASLRDVYRTHICGAAIITEYFLITAAHCIVDETPESITVYVGSVYLDHGGTYHRVHRLAAYPDFNRTEAFDDGNDVGVIELKKAMELVNNIKAIHLPIGIVVHPGDKVLGDGWGYISYGWGFGEDKETNQLQYSERTIISNKECSEKVDTHIGSEQMCFDGEDGSGACFGDSGSPLVYTINNSSYVVGLSSWVHGCGIGYPSMYTNVSNYLPWIQKQLSKGRNVRRKSNRK